MQPHVHASNFPSCYIRTVNCVIQKATKQYKSKSRNPYLACYIYGIIFRPGNIGVATSWQWLDSENFGL